MGKLRKNKIFVQENTTSTNRNNDNIKCNNEAEGQKGKPLLKSFIVDLLISAGTLFQVEKKQSSTLS